ncbi:hypothetical protein [Lacticaseibacillus jixiensis]|uniref:hypothetical protein n=1 Tax=Lacticaseibacillus jixiensis TaxID=3231926 RepID=UPI0036F3A714
MLNSKVILSSVVATGILCFAGSTNNQVSASANDTPPASEMGQPNADSVLSTTLEVILSNSIRQQKGSGGLWFDLTSTSTDGKTVTITIPTGGTFDQKERVVITPDSFDPDNFREYTTYYTYYVNGVVVASGSPNNS